MSETFPALLFVNCNLQAGSWAKKEVPIQKSDYEIAAANNVLIIRVEDLVRIWDAVTEKAISLQEVLEAFKSKCGWLECGKGKLTIHA